MAPAGFPEAGSQVRRKSDGVLGEVYDTDPPARVSVRWATTPGAFAREDCSADQFARAWELTGARIPRPRDTHTALGLIAFTVLLFFVVVLVHDTTSAYTGSDPYKPLAVDSPSVLDSAQALDSKYGMQAAETCATGADEYIRSITRHRFHWVQSDVLAPYFDRFSPNLSAPGVLTMMSGKARVSNGFGVFHPIEIYCNYDTQSSEVLSYTAEDAGQ